MFEPEDAASSIRPAMDQDSNLPSIPGQHLEEGLAQQHVGLILALSSSIFIGASFIIKKRGLRIAGSTGIRAGMGGFSYLREPTWWLGMISMIVGEAANFAAYAFAPAILVTPLGALSIIVSAILAHLLLNERLNMYGMLGCALCIVGSITIVLHAPPEREIHSVVEVWNLAMQPLFLGYAILAITFITFLIWVVAPSQGSTNIFVYLAICSLAGSLSVMSCKALGIAIKLTFQGDNQLLHVETYFCAAVVLCCVLTQMNYLNKALDLYNTAIVSPVYYVMFTTLTILASVILFRDAQNAIQLTTELCGFLTIVGGTILLHATKDLDTATMSDTMRLPRQTSSANGGLGERSGSTGVLLGSVKDRDAARERVVGVAHMADRDGGPSYHAVALDPLDSGGVKLASGSNLSRQPYTSVSGSGAGWLK